MKSSPLGKSLACLVASGVMLGLLANLAKIAGGHDLEPLAFLFWSLVGSSVLLGAVAATRGAWPPVNRRAMEYYFVAGLLGVAAPNYVCFAAAPRVGAGFVALSLAFPPAFTYVGALGLGMERFQASRALGIVLALSGAALLAVFKLNDPEADLLWTSLTLGVPVVLAVGNLYRTARWPAGATAEQLAPGTLAASALLTGMAGLGLSAPLSVSLGSSSVGLVVAQSATFAAFFLLFFVLQKIAGPVYVSLTGSVAAAAGAAIAVGVLGESSPRGLAIAAVLIATGIALLMRRPAAAASHAEGDSGNRQN